MLEKGFVRLHSDYSVFLHFKIMMIVAIYVDDLLIAGLMLDDIIDFKESISERFRIKDLGSIFFYLNVKITRDRVNKVMHLSQTAYIKQLIEVCDLTDCNSVATSMEQTSLHHDVHDGQFYQAIGEEITSYAEVIGKLQWLATNTRQDIAYAINKLSQFMKNSTLTHVQAVKRVVRYLKGTMELGKRFGSSETHDSSSYGYTDSSYGDDELTRRSHSGYAFLFYNGVISHFFRRQDTVSTSSTEAEYVGQCNAVKEAYFLKQVFNELGENIKGSMKIRADNQSVMALAKNSGNHRRTKHISIQYHYVRELVQDNEVDFTYVPTADMLADGLTKPLGRQLFERFVSMLGLVSSPAGCV